MNRPPAQKKVALKFHRPMIGAAERRAVDGVLRSGWLTTGEQTVAFEEEFARYVGARHAVGVMSCTAALHLALVAYGVGPGDEVITTPITFSSTLNVIEHVGARPIFADVLPGPQTIDPADVKRRLTPRTKAVIAVHFAGIPARVDELLRVAGRRPILWDNAHAIETRYRGRRIGGLPGASAYSFYATKNITTGEGGMLTTDDARLADRVRVLRLHGMSRDAWKRYGESGYKHWDTLVPGYKYNMFDLQAALGRTQLRNIEPMWRRRREIVRRYDRAFARLPEIVTLQVDRRDRSAYHLYPILFRTETLRRSRDELLQEIQSRGIGVGVHFRGIHTHAYYRKKYRARGLPTADYITTRTLTIPLFPAMTDREVRRVIDVVTEVVEAAR